MNGLEHGRSETVERADVPEGVAERARKVKLLILDVDGVLTDGRITYASDGTEAKSFDAKDGHGIKLAQRAGIQIALLSGRASEAVMRRARELGIEMVYQQALRKREVYKQILADAALEDPDVAYIGDDVVDIPVLRRAGFPVAVANAADEVRQEAVWVTKIPGGYGAVRETIELILQAQGKWEKVLARYYEP